MKKKIAIIAAFLAISMIFGGCSDMVSIAIGNSKEEATSKADSKEEATSEADSKEEATSKAESKEEATDKPTPPEESSAPDFDIASIPEAPEEDFEYRYDSFAEGIRILNYKGSGDVVKIPNVIEGENVISVDMFYHDETGTVNTTVTAVIIPDSVTQIGEYAFTACGELKQVFIGSGFESGGEGMFAAPKVTEINVSENNPNFCSEDGVLYRKDKRALLDYPFGREGAFTIPDGTEAIGYEAFFGCSKLTSITIPESVTLISFGAFSGCESLTEIVIPYRVYEIGTWAFSYCTSLKSITIGDNVGTISYGAFEGCTELSSIKYKGAEYKSVEEFSAAFDGVIDERAGGN